MRLRVWQSGALTQWDLKRLWEIRCGGRITSFQTTSFTTVSFFLVHLEVTTVLPFFHRKRVRQPANNTFLVQRLVMPSTRSLSTKTVVLLGQRSGSCVMMSGGGISEKPQHLFLGNLYRGSREGRLEVHRLREIRNLRRILSLRRGSAPVSLCSRLKLQTSLVRRRPRRYWRRTCGTRPRRYYPSMDDRAMQPSGDTRI